ncbi:MAG: CotH kinase family protein, partial [Flavobacteriales bacterium]|nr:CotH kinase family protein [Flavobacteriales bacterium]
MTTLFLLIGGGTQAQSLPAEMYLDPANHMLHTGGLPSTGLYAKQTIRTLDLQFAQSSYWNVLTQNYNSQTDIPATLTVDGVVYDSVGVRFKGQTSYSMLPSGSQKRSFNITMDHAIADQDLMGYETLNLNNAFQDASFLREVVYLDLIRDHIPAAKANFVHLNINGASWGLYPNVQQLNSDFLREWYFSNDGSLWRADRPTTVPGGPGGWGDGTAALNDLGADTTAYQPYYTLKRSERTDPWEDLVRVCQKLNQTPLAALEDSLERYLDVDRTLWFLASEIAFGDDDGYVYKGKMDYYLYFDAETERMTPLEYDGNSVMKNSAANWGPFYHADNANYPLLNRMLAVPTMRQRYLAHLRTIIQEKMQSA